MRIFILPSWCPTKDKPLSGSFFLEQAQLFAKLRPSWIVAFCSFDLSGSRIPWRLNQMSKFIQNVKQKPRLTITKHNSGLYIYDVWSPYFPSFGKYRKWETNAKVLAKQTHPALMHFIKNFGKPDLIHARAVYPGGAAAVLLGHMYDIPVGITEHIGPFPGKQFLQDDGIPIPLIRDTYALAKCHSADGSKLAKQIINYGLSSKVQVLPNFLADDFGENSDFILNEKKNISFLSIGGPSFAKGTDILLNAFSNLKTNSDLKIIGDSPEMFLYQQMARNLKIESRVHWLGNISRTMIGNYIQESDVFVLPSRGENFGVSYIEALAYGKPIIATMCGGPEDIVNKLNGLLVPLNDIDGLTKAMNQIIINLNDYRHEEIKEDFKSRFSASSVINQFEKWFISISNGNK